MSDQDIAEQKEVQEEMDCIKQSLSASAEVSDEENKIRINVFEEVSAAEDAHQVVISTNGDLILAKRVTAAVRARQWLGQMTDLSLQQLSQARGIDLADRATTDKAVEPETERAVNFDQYGAGYMLDGGDV